MLTLQELKTNRDLVNKIDWSMTQEQAIEMYLEWGTGWIRGNDFVSYDGQESLYFVLYDWEDSQVTLMRRTTKDTQELAKITVPRELFEQAVSEDGYKPGVGVHNLNTNLRKWLSEAIGGPTPEYIY